MSESLFEIEVADVDPLSVNRAWQGRRFKTPEYKSYEDEWTLLLPLKRKPFLGLVEIEFSFHLKNCNRRDVDNMIKPLLDIIVKRGYIEDDRKVRRIVAEKHPHTRNCVYFAIRPYAQEDAA